MPLSEQETLELLELEKNRTLAFEKINKNKPEQEKKENGFWEGVGKGLTSQEGSGIGHFIGAGLPATIGAGFGGPIGASLGEAGRQLAGAIVNPEETSKKSQAGIFAEVAGAGALQKAGEFVGPMAKKAGEIIEPVTDWLASKIGKSFLKASRNLNAYGHIPEEAIKDEKIIARSWDTLLDKIKIAKQDLAEQYTDLFDGLDKKIFIPMKTISKPIDKAIKEAEKYPTENKALIQRLNGLKEDIDMLVWKNANAGNLVEAEKANEIKKSIYRITKYSANISDEEVLNKTKQEVASNISKRIEQNVPGISELNRRYGNIIALQNAVENRAIVAQKSDIIGLPEMIGGGIAVGGNVPVGAGAIIGNRLLKSPIGATTTITGLKKTGDFLKSEATKDIGDLIGKSAPGIGVNIIEEATKKDNE